MFSLMTCTWTVVQIVIWTVSAQEDHEHYVPRADRGEDLTDHRFTRDTQHIKEDIEKYFQLNLTAAEQLKPENMDYYYFVLHDFDKNKKLDGLELLKAIQHVIDHHGHQIEGEAMEEKLENFAKGIDQVLATDDLDKDGFVSYPEYMYAQQRYQAESTSTTVLI